MHLPWHAQANKDRVRGVVMRLPPLVYTKDFAFFYDVMYKAAEKKGSASYIGDGTPLPLFCLRVVHCLHIHENLAGPNDSCVCLCFLTVDTNCFLPQLNIIYTSWWHSNRVALT